MVQGTLSLLGLYLNLTKGTKFAYCKLCYCHFTVSHGGIHDIKRHVDCQKHKLKFNESDKSAKIAREPQNQGYLSGNNAFPIHCFA